MDRGLLRVVMFLILLSSSGQQGSQRSGVSFNPFSPRSDQDMIL